MAAKAKERTRVERLLLATDFSPAAESAARRAGRLPLKPGASLVLLHVLRRGLTARVRRQSEQSAQVLLGRAAAELEARAQRAGNEGVRVEQRLVRGAAYVEIIRAARAHGSELTVVGGHPPGAVRDLLLGGTWERVVRGGQGSVLVVKRRPTGPYLRPLVSLELSNAAREIAGGALSVVDPSVRQVALLHAYEVPFEGQMASVLSPKELDEYRRECRVAATRGLRELMSYVQELDVRWQRRLCPGDPRLVILDEAQRRRSDLIAVGTHARSGVARSLLGSVAEYVVRAATCDVLVVELPRVSFQAP